ncbi:MAG: phosphoesterase PA-phosphatase [candidate division KSB1 bacterium]|nr:phosphoesterase PA-phosphatase [candidate division KSB1 bacterium]MDZ7384909.1 phosphoesterase PA-phosphatase [candidate division KSB1 bacterium]MDZ7391963.1 phosphoesterase PA-phosphatase [candidate division KSB1 bacterium]MDZ7412038.1 phosphoesterase PA-phosphatase [candidate division KSB1 bacterium]
MERIAKVISNVTIPTVFSAIVFLIISLHAEAYFLRGVLVTVICWLTASVLPAAYVLRLVRQKRVSDKHVPIREQRTRPYLVATVCYALGLVLVKAVGAPFPVWGLMWCYVVNTLVLALINLRWKMSAHAMGAAGALAGLTYALGMAVAPSFFLVLVVGWARIRLRAHTVAQVVAGALAGAGLTFVQLHLLARLFG